MTSFQRAADYLLDPENTQRIREDLGSYFDNYVGRHFEEFIARSDPDRFTSDDVAALSCLAVELKGGPLTTLLIERSDELNELLSDEAMPRFDADLRQVDGSVIAHDSPLSHLYGELTRIRGIGYVRASKLLAAKRPSLVPIRDRVVETFVQAGEQWWSPYRDLVMNEGLVDRVVELSDGVPERVSVLRRVDVVLWMAGKRGLAPE